MYLGVHRPNKKMGPAQKRLGATAILEWLASQQCRNRSQSASPVFRQFFSFPVLLDSGLGCARLYRLPLTWLTLSWLTLLNFRMFSFVSQTLVRPGSIFFFLFNCCPIFTFKLLIFLICYPSTDGYCSSNSYVFTLHLTPTHQMRWLILS